MQAAAREWLALFDGRRRHREPHITALTRLDCNRLRPRSARWRGRYRSFSFERLLGAED
jgi:hypothetical protein